MTIENYNKATYIQHDLELLMALANTQKLKHWVGFVTADNEDKTLCVFSETLIADLKDFVVAELDKLNKEFEAL